MTVLEAFKPDIVECLCDTLPASNQTEKRIRKSVDRTLKFLDKCIAEKDSRVGQGENHRSVSYCEFGGVFFFVKV